MNNKILLAYASTHGSTQEIAEVIASTLSNNGITIDLQLARNVRTLHGYQAIILGAPLYMFHLHKDALRFLSKHKKAFTGGLPLAIFAGGPTEIGKDQWAEIRQQLDKELAKFPWLKPATIEIVGGKFDASMLRFPWNLIPALKQTPPSDLRDWEAIRNWARKLPTVLQLCSENNGRDQR
jgi:menaquinone-dependent protoporphyrinogen oxidase